MWNSNLFQQFSCAEYLADKTRQQWTVEPWKILKDRGNDALKLGDLQSAAKLYQQSAVSTLAPHDSGVAAAFARALASWPPHSSRKQLSECADVLDMIMRKLPRPMQDETVTAPSGKVLRASYPHAGAAIAWANHAHVMLLLRNPQQALASARRATKANPEYVKGHYREMRALESLGDTAAAALIREEIDDYERTLHRLPADGIRLMAVGWISIEQAALIYFPVRQREVVGSSTSCSTLPPALPHPHTPPPGAASHTASAWTRQQARGAQSLHRAFSGANNPQQLAAARRLPLSHV